METKRDVIRGGCLCDAVRYEGIGEPCNVTHCHCEAGRARSFCGTCGSALTFMRRPDTDEIDVTVATFDQPEIISPGDHIWTEDRMSWIKLADNLPQHAQGRTK